jgi:hypothetical protein
MLELETFVASMTERFVVESVGKPEATVRRGPTLVPAKGATVRVRPCE